MRLDQHLKKKHGQYSRAYLQKLIKAGAVLVNGKKVSPHYQIKPSDKITENITPPEKIDLSPDESIKLDVVYEDENYLVINKPAGLVVHPSESVKSHTLINALLAHYPPIKNVGDKKNNINYQLPVPSRVEESIINYRPGIVHRLDKDASGVMIIAKTQTAFDDLKKQFQKHTIKKEYTALVYGNVKKDSGEINRPIGRSSKGYKMSTYGPGRTRSLDRVPKAAVTKFEVVKPYKNFTLLKIQSLTGRTHQIRVHLHAIGHPIVGDPIYTHKNTKTRKHENNRLFLHADLLEFCDLKNQAKKFKLDLPSELKNILKKLNNK